jgi:hypothetical protein
MKHKLMILFVFAFGTLVWSCGEDDPKVDLPGPIRDSKIYDYGIIAPAGATITSDRTLKLSDFTALDIYERYVKKGDVNTDSYIEFIKGASDSLQLKDVTLQVKNNASLKYNLGTLTGDYKFNTLQDLIFLQSVVNEMVSKKETELQLSYNSTDALSKQATLNINLDITFSF